MRSMSPIRRAASLSTDMHAAPFRPPISPYSAMRPLTSSCAFKPWASGLVHPAGGGSLLAVSECRGERMAIVQALLAALFRSAGKLLNMAFGWATIMLFGKVPQDRQLYLSVIAFGSVIWLVGLVAIVFPGFGAFLLAFVTLPPWVNRAWIR